MITIKATSQLDAYKQATAAGFNAYATREIGTTGYFNVYTFKEFQASNMFSYC